MVDIKSGMKLNHIGETTGMVWRIDWLRDFYVM